MPKLLTDEEIANEFGQGAFRAQPPETPGLGYRFGAALDSAQANILGVGEAFGLPVGDMRRRNQFESEDAYRHYYESTGAPQSWRDIGSVSDAGQWLGGLAVDSAPVLGSLAASGLAGGPLAAFAAGSLYGTGDVLQNQREAGGRTNVVAAVPLGLAYGAMDSLTGVGGMAARRAAGTGLRIVDDLAVRSLDDIGGALGAVARTGAAAGKTALAEGIGETGQEITNQIGRMTVNRDERLFSPDALRRYEESFVGGAALGGAVGGAAGGWRRQSPALTNVPEPALPTTRDGGLNLLGTPALEQVETAPMIAQGIREMPDGTLIVVPEEERAPSGRPGWVARQNTPRIPVNAEIGTQGDLIPRRFSDPVRPVEQFVDPVQQPYVDTATRDLFADTPSAMLPTMFNPASEPSPTTPPARASAPGLGAVAANIRSQLSQQLGRTDGYTTKLAFDMSRAVGDLGQMQGVVEREQVALDKALAKLDKQVSGESNLLDPDEYAARRSAIEDKQQALEAAAELVGQYQSAQTRAFAEEAAPRKRQGVRVGSAPESNAEQEIRIRNDAAVRREAQQQMADEIAQVDAWSERGRAGTAAEARMRILQETLSEPTRRAPVARFREALRKAGIRNLDITPQEQAEITRITSRRAEVAAATVTPPGLARATGRLTPRASLDAAPAPVQDPVQEIEPVTQPAPVVKSKGRQRVLKAVSGSVQPAPLQASPIVETPPVAEAKPKAKAKITSAASAKASPSTVVPAKSVDEQVADIERKIMEAVDDGAADEDADPEQRTRLKGLQYRLKRLRGEQEQARALADEIAEERVLDALAKGAQRKAKAAWNSMRDADRGAPEWEALSEEQRSSWTAANEKNEASMALADQMAFGDLENTDKPLAPKPVKITRDTPAAEPKVNGERYTTQVPTTVTPAKAKALTKVLRDEIQANNGRTRAYYFALADVMTHAIAKQVAPEAKTTLENILLVVPKEDVDLLRISLGLEPKVSQQLATLATNPDGGKSKRVDPLNALTAHSALDWLSENASTAGFRELAKRLRPHVSDIPINYVSEGTMVPLSLHADLRDSNGIYVRWPATGREEVWLWENASSEELILHELLHAATHQVIEDNGDLKQMIGDIGRAMSNALTSAKYDTRLAPPGVDKNTLSFFSSQMRRPHEVLTYGMTSPTFTELMQRMAGDGDWMSAYRTPEAMANAARPRKPQLPLRPEPKVALWKKFVDAVRSALGMPKVYSKDLERVIAYNNAVTVENKRRAKVELIPVKEVLDGLLAEVLRRKATSETLASGADGSPEIDQNARGRGDRGVDAPSVLQNASQVEINDDPDLQLPDFNPPKGFRTWIEDRVTDVKASGAGLGWLTMRQIGAIYSKFPAVQSFVELTQAMVTKARKLQGEAFKVDLEWQKLSDANSLELQKLMLEATMAEAHIDLPVDHALNKHLGSDERKAEHARLAARFNALVAEDSRAAEVYAKVRDKMRKDWEERGKLLRSRIVDAYRPELFGVGDIDKLADTPMKERDDVLKAQRSVARRRALRDLWSDLDEHGQTLKRMVGPYFPLMRFGQHVVVVKSPAYTDALAVFEAERDALQGLNTTEVEPGTPEAAELEEAIKEQRKAVNKARQALETVKGKEQDYAVEFYEKKSEAVRRKDELVKFYADKGRPDIAVDVRMREQYVRQMDSASPVFLRKIEDAIKSSLPTKDAAAVERAMRDLLIQSMPERSALKAELRRIGVKGANPAQMRRAFAASAVRNSWYLSRLQFGNDLHEAMVNLRSSLDDTEKNVGNELARRYVSSLTYEENNPVADFISNATYVTYLGLSPSFLLMNLAQPWVVSAPLLASRRGVGMAMASRFLGSAFTEVGSAMRSSMKDAGTFRFELDLKKFSDTGERQMLETLFDKGIIDITFEHDVGAVASGRAETTWGKTVELAALPAHHTEVLNRVMTALAAYRIAQQKGDGVGQATAYAEKIVHESHLDYTPENAPRWFTQFGAPGRLVLQFGKYAQGMMYLLGRNSWQMLKGDKEARKAMAWIFGTHFAVGGMTGLPLAWVVGGIASLVSQMSADDDEPDYKLIFRDGLASIVGNTLADLMMKGAPAALVNADLSNRVGLGDLGNPLAMNRANSEGREWFAYTVLSLLGPAASIAGNVAEAASVAGTDPLKATAMVLPKVIADPLRAINMATSGLTARSGNTIIPASEIGAGEIALRTVGMQATTQSNMYERRAAFYEAKSKRDEVRSALIKEWAKAQRGNGDLSATAKKVREFNQRHPDNPIAGKHVQQHLKQERRRQQELRGGVQVRKQDAQLAEDLGLSD